MLNKLKTELRNLKNPEKKEILQSFFKTRKGQYGEGDIFLGITVPIQRKIAKQFFKEIALSEVEKLLHSEIHEFRFTAILILLYKFEISNENEKKQIYELYLKNTKWINNWDLVDVSAHKIVGKFLFNKNREILYKLAKSNNLWEKRISIVSTFYFINKNQFEDTIKVSKILVNDSHDLIQKAVGWMLREVGKRNQNIEENFLKTHYKTMPRTMLRYAIEKFTKEKKDYYMGRN